MKLTDLYNAYDLFSYHDMGVEEFFKKKVTEEEVIDYLSSLRETFRSAEQQRTLSKIEKVWIEELHSDV
jgi:hypothetical protein